MASERKRKTKLTIDPHCMQTRKKRTVLIYLFPCVVVYAHTEQGYKTINNEMEEEDEETFYDTL